MNIIHRDKRQPRAQAGLPAPDGADSLDPPTAIRQTAHERMRQLVQEGRVPDPSSPTTPAEDDLIHQTWARLVADAAMELLEKR